MSERPEIRRAIRERPHFARSARMRKMSERYLVNGAILKCSRGSESGELQLLERARITLQFSISTGGLWFGMTTRDITTLFPHG